MIRAGFGVRDRALAVMFLIVKYKLCIIRTKQILNNNCSSSFNLNDVDQKKEMVHFLTGTETIEDASSNFLGQYLHIHEPNRCRSGGTASHTHTDTQTPTPTHIHSHTHTRAGASIRAYHPN